MSHLSMAGGLSRPALNSHPQICGTRNGLVRGVKYVSLWQTCDMYILYQASRSLLRKSIANEQGRERKRSPAIMQIMMTRLESQASPMSEDVEMESSTDSHTAFLRACQ